MASKRILQVANNDAGMEKGGAERPQYSRELSRREKVVDVDDDGGLDGLLSGLTTGAGA